MRLPRTRQLYVLAVLALLILWADAALERVVKIHLLPAKATGLLAGTFIMVLGIVLLLDRELALNLYWKGDRDRPSDAAILLFVRAMCLIGVAVTGYIMWPLVRELLLNR